MGRSQKDWRETESMLYRLTQLLMAHAGSESDYRVHRANAESLRRISMTLQRWHEHECNGNVQRDDSTGVAYWCSTQDHARRWKTPDLESGARNRLATILKSYPQLLAYVQTDPRGCAVYVLKPGDVPAGEDVGSYYTRGVAVYR